MLPRLLRLRPKSYRRFLQLSKEAEREGGLTGLRNARKLSS
jgi:hypothetical protein